MKNFLVLLVLSLFLSAPSFSFYLACDSNGQAWAVSLEEPVGVALPAGGCAGGPWLIDIEMYNPNDPTHVHSSYMANLINQYFVPGGTHISQEKWAELENIVNGGTTVVHYIDLQYIDADIRDDVRDLLTN